MSNTVKAMFVNGSPRKGWNTAKMLESAMQGAADAGAESPVVVNYFYHEEIIPSALKEHEAARWLVKEELDCVHWLPADVQIIEKLKQSI